MQQPFVAFFGAFGSKGTIRCGIRLQKQTPLFYLAQTDFVPWQQHGNSCWTKPNAGRYKCNIDASFSKHLNKVGLGMFIRDEHGTFVLAKTDWFSSICEVLVGEALGLISTLEWCMSSTWDLLTL